MPHKKIILRTITKQKVIEFFNKEYYEKYRNMLLENEMGNAYFFQVSHNSKNFSSPTFQDVYDGKIASWESNGFLVIFPREVLTEKIFI